MGTFNVAGAELKKMIKVAKKGPVSFAFNPAKDDENSYCGMHRAKPPALIGKEAKDEGEGAKFTFGTAVVAGKLMTLTVMRDLPGLAKKFKRFLKSQKVMLNVQIMDEDGNIIESDIEEDLPDDPDLEGETAESEGGEGETVPEAPPLPDPAALLKRLAELRGRIAALPPEAAGRLAGPFREVVELAKAGDVARASAGADRIEAALAMLEGRGGGEVPVAPPTAPPDGEMQKLRQLVQAMRDKAGAIPDAAAKAAILEALARADALIGARETEQAVAILKKVQPLLAKFAGGTADPAAEWDRRFRALEPRVNAALSQGLVADVDGLRKAWDWATGNAADGAFDKALAGLPQVETLLAAVPQGGGNAFAEGIAPDAQPFARARVIWAGARSTMLSETKRLESEIVAAFANDEMLSEVQGAVGALTGEVLRLDARLEDKMDEIVGTPAGEAREALKGQARGLIAEYRGLLAAAFFQEVDQASGFGSFAVTSTATAALAEIEGAIA